MSKDTATVEGRRPLPPAQVKRIARECLATRGKTVRLSQWRRLVARTYFSVKEVELAVCRYRIFRDLGFCGGTDQH